MRFKFYHQPVPSEITPESVWLNRRKFIKAAGLISAAAPFSSLLTSTAKASEDSCELNASALPQFKKSNTLKQIENYNNYFEFSTEKKYVKMYAKDFKSRPWSIQIDGEVEQPVTLDIDKLLSQYTQEERIYSMRCVEGWSMVIPWDGFPLCQLLKQVKPTSRAKYVEFISVLRPEEMIGQRRDTLSWPYREALRIDEAMHPLTILASGIYGKPISNQNGAPLRLVVPWKYGFKSIKAITHIKLTEQQPGTIWNEANPENYGFYANVNPDVSTSNWSQRREVQIGQLRKKRTQLFNGYGEHVAHLYKGMDLSKFY